MTRLDLGIQRGNPFGFARVGVNRTVRAPWLATLALWILAGLPASTDAEDAHADGARHVHEIKSFFANELLADRAPMAHLAPIVQGITNEAKNRPAFDPTRFGLFETLDDTIDYGEVSHLLSFDLFHQLNDPQRILLRNLSIYGGMNGPLAAACFSPGTSKLKVDVYERAIWGNRDPDSKFQILNRWTTTATDGAGLGQGDPTVITYSFAPDGTPIGGLFGGAVPSELFSVFDAEFGSTNAWQSLFHDAFARWGELTATTYIHESNDDASQLFSSPGVLGVHGDVRIAGREIDGSGGILAFNIFPQNGDMVLDTLDVEFFGSPLQGFLNLTNVVEHEHGHGMGLLHVCPDDETKLMEPFITTLFDGPQHDDIQAGQRLYGDPNEHNDTAATATNLGALDGTSIEIDNVSIDDNLDTDYYSFSVVGPRVVSVGVEPVGFVYNQGSQFPNCGSGTPYDSEAVSNLALLVLDGNGSSLLAGINANPTGAGEQLPLVPLLNDGQYFARVLAAGGVDNVQLYRLTLADTGLGFSLSINGNSPENRIVPVFVPSNAQIALDMEAGSVAETLSWHFLTIEGDAFTWITDTGAGSPTEAALVEGPPLDLDDEILFIDVFDTAQVVTYLFYLRGPSGRLLGFDFITALPTALKSE